MAYNGKHSVQNHPKVNIKPGPIILATLTLVGILKANSLLKKDNEIDLSPKGRIDSTVSKQTIDSIINSLKDKYHLSDDYGLTFEGLLYDFFENKFNGLNDNEKEIILEELLKSKDLEELISHYIKSKSSLPIRMYNFIDNPEAKVNIKIITTNESLMSLIDKLSLTYGIDKGLIISCIAQNMTGGLIDKQNPMGIGEKWYNLDSTYTIYNYSLDGPETIEKIEKSDIKTLEEALKYNIIIAQSSIKQSSGDSIEALSYLKYGPTLVRINTKESEEVKKATDEILSILSFYYKRNSFNLTTYYTLNKDNKSKKIERVQSYEYTDFLYNELLDYLTNWYKNNYDLIHQRGLN